MEVDDFIGGWLMIIAAGMQCVTIRKAYLDKAVKGASPWTMWYFMFLNGFYVVFFLKRDLWWGMIGESALVVVWMIWWGQYLYYEKGYLGGWKKGYGLNDTIDRILTEDDKRRNDSE